MQTLEQLRDEVASLRADVERLKGGRVDSTTAEPTTAKPTRIGRIETQALRTARELLPGSLTVKEAAKELGVTTKTIGNYIDGGLLRSEKVGTRRMIPREAMDAFKDSLIKE